MNTGQLPNDIHGLVPYIGDRLEKLALLALALLLLILLVVWAWRRWQRRVKVSKPAAPMAAEDLASMLRRRLDALQPQNPFDADAQREFFFQLSWILRAAIEHVASVPATDLTYDELVAALAGRPLPLGGDENAAVLGFLRRADAVKFADAEESKETAEAAQAMVRRWVRTLLIPLTTAGE